MGFLYGRVSFLRFRVTGRSPKHFGPEHVERLAAHAIGKQRVATADGTESGWIAGDHILDKRFDLAKNVIADTLHFALRIDSPKIPSDLVHAYAQEELETLAAQNPSGVPSSRQKREARLAARERIEKEAEDGRYLQRKSYPVLWDGPAGELLVAATSQAVIEKLYPLFKETFNHGFELVGAGQRAFLLAELHEQTRAVEDARPADFISGLSTQDLAWIPEENSRDFLGNEFLLWLWYVLDEESDAIELADGSEVTVMLSRSLTLECPRGQTGKETISSEAPSRLPESRRAIQAGKLPRKAGMTLVRHDHQYEVVIQAETLAVSGAKLPATEAEEIQARREERMGLVRHLIETLDLLYDAFGSRRAGSAWNRELGKMRKWLMKDDRQRLATLSAAE